MRKLYISLLLFLAVGFCQMGVKAQYLLPLSFIHEFVPDLEAHSGLPGAFTIRYADNGDMNVFAVPYKGITAGPGVTDSDVVAIINQMIDMAQGGGLADYVMCIGVTGVDTSNPMASEGFIYFISKLFYLSNPFHYEVILWSSMNFGSWAHIIHNYDPYLSNHYGYKLFSDEYIIYGLEYSESGSNVNFSITGPRAEISTFSLRKVVWGQSASTWQTVATFNHTIPWTPANIPSAVFSVAASQLQSGERYALVNNTYNQVASNVVEYGSAALSPTVFNVTGAWANPPQQMSYSVSLSGSQAGVSYSLVRVSETPTSPILNTTVAMITGTGSAITFAGIIQNGVYKVVAKQGNTTVDMNGEVTVVMPPLQIFAVTGSWNNQQQTSFSVTLSGSQAGVSYALILERRYPTLPLQNTQVTTMSGTGNSITFAGLTQTGIYKIVAKRGNETLEMNGRADMSSSAIMTVTNTNHIRTRRYTTAAGNLFSESATHYDGLGRPVQTVSVAAGGNGNDIIRLVAYDNMGRSDMTTYMPFTRSSLGFKMAAFATGEQQEYYNQKFATDPDRLYAFGQKKFEYSAAEDKVIQSAPGENTRMQGGRTLHTVARASRANENIKKMAIIAADNRSLHYQGHYPDKALTVTESWQEAGVGETKVVSAEYVDVRGHLVAKRVTAGNDIRTTYYVYDDMGNQRYIIPPIQESSIAVLNAQYSPEQLQRHCFYMVYDRYGNVVEQWVPGADPVYSVYDRRGRLVMSQSGNQRANNRNEWSYFKYDALDRQVYSGIHVGGTLQAHRDAVASPTNVLNERRGGAVHGYTSLSYPSNVTASSVLAVTYYDDYDWPGANLLAFSTADLLAGNASAPSFDITGLATGTKLKVLDATATTDQWLTTVTYYDKDYRSVQSVGELYPSGIEVVSNDHNFTGAVTQTKVKQTIDGQSYEYNKWFVYDSQGRLLHVDQAMTGDSGNGRVRLASYSYDDMNVTSTKSIHDGRETTGYTYRMTGQLWRETSPSFSYALGFDRAADAGLSFRRDGKLASVAWGAGSDLTKAYNFTYDVVGQLTAAHFSQKSGGTWTAQPQFAESGLTYDLNGNILTLTRTAEQPQGNQNIQYTYNHATRGNLLTSVSFGGTNFAFSYDANGNMVDDMMAGTKIVYNLLDLPEKIHAQNNANNNIRYIYSASGEKLSSIAGGSVTYYRSVFTYAGDDLQYVMHPEGLVARTNNAWEYRYFKRDHVGSTRVVLAARGGGLTSVQATDYYPFGMAHGSLNNLHLNRYLYGGKEYQDALINGKPLGLYDFHARYYNPMLGRWFNIDPALQTTNPYLYCGNSPMMYVDPDGEFFWLVVAAFAVGNLVANAIAGNIDNFWDAVSYTFQGALAGAMVGGAFAGFAAMGASSMGLVSGIGKAGTGLMKAYAWGQAGVTAGGFVGGVVQSIDQGSWKPLGNWAKLTLGNFYLDENDWLRGAWHGFTRHTWEMPQQFTGHGYSQLMNSFGRVDHVKYFGGATFAIDDNSPRVNSGRGISMGSFINVEIRKEFNKNYPGGWIYGADGLYLHEYGHVFDSRRFGLSYLLAVGIPSATDAEWTETRANNFAWRYMKRHNLLDSWEKYEWRFPLK